MEQPIAYDCPMARTQTMVQLNTDLLADLDREAAARGVSRSALARDAIAAYLSEGRSTLVDRLIVEGYRRSPAATPDEWGSLVDHGDVAAAETLQRMDAEERQAGLEPW